ncbi:MAG: site-specific DNA-methyltransferase, partial [Ginsengibacter sp.]
MEVTFPKISAEILQKLKAIIPDAFDNGKLNLEKLKLLLGDMALSNVERFEISWPGKLACRQVLEDPIKAILIPQKAESINWDTTENILIEGENLEVLKVLQEKYCGKIKTIYIDPPYNTGNNSFTYGDNFSETPRESISRHDRAHGHDNSIKVRLMRNKQNGQLHASWLSMMFPRLILARNLLRDDGLFFVSIDDNELANLKLIMDEIFGANNYVDIFSWAKSETPANLSRKSKKIVEYVLCYQKNRNSEKF